MTIHTKNETAFIIFLILSCISLTNPGCKNCRQPKKIEKKEPEFKPTEAKTSKESRTVTAMPPILPEGKVHLINGEFKTIRSSLTSVFPIADSERENLYIGDKIYLREGSKVEIEFPYENAKAILEGTSTLEVGTHFPGEIVLIEGICQIFSPQIKGKTKRIKLQTPAGTFFHAGPESIAAVAVDGSTKIFAKNCPSHESETQGNSTDGLRSFGCSFLMEEEEKNIDSGTAIEGNYDLKTSFKENTDETYESIKNWLIERKKEFQSGKDERILWYAKWIRKRFEELDDTLNEMENMRLRNKSYLDELKKIRNEESSSEKPEKKQKQKKAGSTEKRVSELKLALAENSSSMAKKREVLLSKWYQLLLRWENMKPYLDDGFLQKFETNRATIEAFIASYDEKILQIVKRRPRKTLPAQMPLQVAPKFNIPIPPSHPSPVITPTPPSSTPQSPNKGNP